MKVLNTKNKFLFLSTFISTLIYLLWRVFFTIPLDNGTFAIVCGIILLTVEITGMLEAAEHYYSMSSIQRPPIPIPPLSWYPDVDVFVATFNEPVELLRKTLNGCVNMDYPDKSKVHIYICDDGNCPAMKALAEKLNVGYLTREDHKGAKAGNLNNAMSLTNSPLIATFDADMIPMHDFLTSVVPYFYISPEERQQKKRKEKKIGFIQTPQCFYNPDLFQYNLFSEGRIPDEQDYFYRDVQISRNKTNSVIYGGSNTLLSRAALNEVGGFFTGVITEDFATGILIQSKGYTCYAIETPHASGLSPSDLKSLIKQRARWAGGCIQTGRKLNILFRRGLTFIQRMSYLSSIFYWYSPIKRLVYIMSPILFSVFHVIVVKCTLLEVLLFWLPMYLFNNATLKMLSNGIRNTRWTNVYETILFPALLPKILLETIGIKKKKFSVTQKDGSGSERAYQLLQAIPHGILALLCFWGIINCVRWMFVTGSPTYIVVLFWLITNCYTLVMSMFFMMGRPIQRKAERFRAQIGCNLDWGDGKLKCETYDISENGFSVLLDFPYYISDSTEIDATLSTERFSSHFKCKIANASQMDNHWKIAARITHIEEDELDKLYSIVYDRQPSLPTTLSRSVSIFDDLSINLQRRAPKPDFFNRHLVRISLDRTLQTKEGIEVILKNFNYAYVLIDTKSPSCNPDTLTIPLENGMEMKCVLHKNTTEPNSKVSNLTRSLCLYRVTNERELGNNAAFCAILKVWMEEFEEKQRMENERMRVAVKGIDDEFNERDYL